MYFCKQSLLRILELRVLPIAIPLIQWWLLVIGLLVLKTWLLILRSKILWILHKLWLVHVLILNRQAAVNWFNDLYMRMHIVVTLNRLYLARRLQILGARITNFWILILYRKLSLSWINLVYSLIFFLKLLLLRLRNFIWWIVTFFIFYCLTYLRCFYRLIIFSLFLAELRPFISIIFFDFFYRLISYLFKLLHQFGLPLNNLQVFVLTFVDFCS
jgi:hypothetical protein